MIYPRFQCGFILELFGHLRAVRRTLPDYSAGADHARGYAADDSGRSGSLIATRRPSDEADLDWADFVMTGGMLFQQADSLRLISRAHAHGKPIAIGGPDATSSPHIYAAADFRVLGEAEGIIDTFVAAWEAGERAGDFRGAQVPGRRQKSPIPRFDLLKFKDYLFIGVQFSRGCPFTCEFCDIIELYGRVPRTKTTPQMLAELDALYALGYRGHVDFVDDNLIGNKKAVRAFLPHLKAWQEAHDFPFEFSTEASINIADDAELLESDEGLRFLRDLRRDRESRSSHPRGNEEETEYAPQSDR